jgi:hypothetical protein
LIVYVPVTDRFGCQPSGSPAEARVGKPPAGGAEVGAGVDVVGAPLGELDDVDGAVEELAGALGLTLVDGLGLSDGGALEGGALADGVGEVVGSSPEPVGRTTTSTW